MSTMTVEEMKAKIRAIKEDRELAECYASCNEQYWTIEDTLYDYDFGTPEYLSVNETVQKWNDLLRYLGGKIYEKMSPEAGDETLEDLMGDTKISEFMERNGYMENGGLWSL